MTDAGGYRQPERIEKRDRRPLPVEITANVKSDQEKIKELWFLPRRARADRSGRKGQSVRHGEEGRDGGLYTISESMLYFPMKSEDISVMISAYMFGGKPRTNGGQ